MNRQHNVNNGLRTIVRKEHAATVARNRAQGPARMAIMAGAQMRDVTAPETSGEAGMGCGQ